MGLTFILGASGAGKTEWMYEKILKTAKEHPGRTVLVVVPEQFSLQTMKDLILRSETKSMSNIEVLSFLRLSYRVFEELGVEPGELLSDVGKSLLIKRVVNRLAGELRVFAANVKKAGFVDEMKSLVSEFYQYGITPESLEQMLELSKEEPVLHKKLRDISLIYKGFAESIEGKYLATETISDVLAEVIEQSSLLKDCDVFFDGFTGFTPSQYGLLSKLFGHAGNCYMSLTMDRKAVSGSMAEHGLFHLTLRTKAVVSKLAEQAGCSIEVLFPEEEVTTQEDKDGNCFGGGTTVRKGRFAADSPLGALERGLFRYPLPEQTGCGEAILLYAKQNRKAEAAFIAADIARRVRTEGVRFGKIAVVTGDIAGYGEYLLAECTKAGVPAFLDSKRKMFHNPCIGLLRAVLQNALNGFSYESVFRYLKSGLTDDTREEVAVLENYCLACGIRGESMWKKEWKYRYRTRQEVDLAYLNGLRERIYATLGGIGDVLKHAKTAGERTRALYEFLENLRVEEKLHAMEQSFEEQGDPVRASEYKQVYGKVMDILDRFMELLDTEEMSLREYIELMETALRECKVGFIPPGTDCVVIGDMTRTRLSDIDVLYVAGVNEGVTPAPGSTGGLISEAEREFFKVQNVELAPTKNESVYMEQFYLYTMLTKPRSCLVLTYSRLSSEGEALQPSYFVRRVGELFYDFAVREEEEKSYVSLLSNDMGKARLLNGLRKYAEDGTAEDAAFWELYRRYCGKSEEEMKRLLRTAFFGNPTGSITEAAAKRLYGAVLYGSVTRLEKYAACAFAHFMQYGLSLEERAVYKAAAPELGTLYHTALELFTKKVRDRELSWHTISKEEREILCSESLAEAAETFENGVFGGTKRNNYLVTKAERVLNKTVEMLQEQIRGSLFEPRHCEAVFEHTAKYLSLRGKIDRYDVCNSEGKWYLRVVDYKSGKKKFDLAELYYGLQVQLEVYMAAAMRQNAQEDNITPAPAGMFYFHVDDPYLEREKYSEDAVKAAFRPDGVFNGTPSAVAALDVSLRAENGGLRPSETSKLIYAETDKEGQLKANSKGIAEEDFHTLTEFVYHKLEAEAEEILEGNTKASPYRYKKGTPCEYCAYHTVCGFDNRLPEFSYRDLKELKKEELWEEFRKESHGEVSLDRGTTTGH
ncbi:MAG: PD-(D/E)XK nuclease family protein [Lachnospiraceae bacterium]|nr:PD-(D/E)XK nuclease family protein [Lachnospiraceae bacterium]